MPIGFKVLGRTNDYLHSARMSPKRASTTFRKACVKYRIGKVTTPKPNYGPLAVFPNLADAFWFSVSLSKEERRGEMEENDEIYLCLYKRSERRYLSFRDESCRQEICPMGTDFADEVILLQKINMEILNEVIMTHEGIPCGISL